MSHGHEPKKNWIHGVVGEFESPETLMSATEQARDAGFQLDTFSPFPIHGLSDSMGFKDERVPVLFFILACLGFFGGWGLEIYANAIDYPLNVGGKPLISIPSFFPVAYECTILCAAVGGVIVMLGLNGFPKPYHPVFAAKNFDRATQDRFFLVLEADSEEFDAKAAQKFLEKAGALSVSVVEDEEL